MDPQQFLAEFGHIANDPAGVPRLRDLVLALAVQVFERMDMLKDKEAVAAVKLGTDSVKAVSAVVAKHMYNYNTVESTLLGCSVFICLAGACVCNSRRCAMTPLFAARLLLASRLLSYRDVAAPHLRCCCCRRARVQGSCSSRASSPATRSPRSGKPSHTSSSL